MFNIQGKVALITGGAGGIGMEYTKSLLLHGCKGVVIVDINEDVGNNVESELRAKYGENRVHFVKADVTNTSELQGAFDKTVQVYNQMDIVINNAGISNEIDFQKTVAINLVAVISGTLLAMRTYLPTYQSGEGIIINTASIAGLLYLPFPIYSITKHGVVTLGKCLAYGCGQKNIKIITICPGLTDTPLMHTLLDDPIMEDIKAAMSLPDIQPVENMGEALISVIQNGENGSVWVCDGKPVYELEIKDQLQI